MKLIIMGVVVEHIIFDIKIDGLQLLPFAWQDSLHGGVTYYQLIGDTPTHPINHFAKPQTIDLVKQIAWEFYKKFGKPLNINDLSLRWGGLFDYKDTWHPPHEAHRYGRQADIRYWDLTLEEKKNFCQIACNLGVDVRVHDDKDKQIDFNSLKLLRNTPLEKVIHFHLRFPKFDTEFEDPKDENPDFTSPYSYCNSAISCKFK